MKLRTDGKDPGEIEVRTFAGSIYLYTHFFGSHIYDDLLHVIHQQQRWDDPSFLTRMIFCRMIPQEQLLGNNGLGIGLIETANVPNRITIDMVKQFIHIQEGQPYYTWAGSYQRFLEDYQPTRELNLER